MQQLIREINREDIHAQDYYNRRLAHSERNPHCMTSLYCFEFANEFYSMFFYNLPDNFFNFFRNSTCNQYTVFKKIHDNKNL